MRPLNALEPSRAIQLSSNVEFVCRGLLGGILGLSLALLLGCSGGGGGPLEPLPDNPIPEQLYQVNLTNPTNDCGASNLDPFKFLALPVNGGTSIVGILESPVASNVTGNRLSFSVPVPVAADTVVTVTGDWTFAEDRHTFDGTVKFAVAFGGTVVCTFTFVSSGLHAVTPSLPDHPDGEGSARGELSGDRTSARSLSPSAWGWGNTGEVAAHGPTCFGFLGGETTLSQQLPGVKARDAFAYPEQDVVWFRFQIYGDTDAGNAGASRLINSLGEFAPNPLYTSRWYWTYAYDSPSVYTIIGGWYDPGGESWGTETNLTLGRGGYYYSVVDVFWQDRDGLGWAWYRTVPNQNLCYAN
jgi:hypothetical protein